MSIIDELNKISIYNYMIVFLVILGIVGNFFLNSNNQLLINVFLRLILVPVFAAIIDLLIKYFLLKKSVEIPKTAIISGLFVAGILDPTTPVYIHFIAAALAILSKHILRIGKRNIFNPAGFGIAITSLVFTYLLGINIIGSWWIGATLLTIPLGLYISYRIEKLPITLSFFVVYILAVFFTLKLSPDQLFDPSFIAGYFFFASFMAVEPRTTPYTLKAMVLFGVIVALLSAILPLLVPPIEFTLVSLMFMNIFKDLFDKNLPDK